MSKTNMQLAEAEKPSLSIGYMRLTDSVPLIMAEELGLYQKYDLQVTLSREVSWANIRDKLSVGALDAAQMLAPQLLMASSGAAGMRVALSTGLVLSLNGNAITLSRKLSEELQENTASKSLFANPEASAKSLAKVVKSKAVNSEPSKKITLATVHLFSCHTLLLHRWLRLGGLDPDTDVRIIVLPPQQMVDSLAKGVIDGYCVGEPWNSVAVQYGIGSIVATGFDIWPNAQEKVLAVTDSWHQKNPGTHLRLRLALMEACAWLSDDKNRLTAANALSRPEHLELIPSMLTPSLTGKLVADKGGKAIDHPDFHLFYRQSAGFPWRDDAEKMVMESAKVIGMQLSEEAAASMAQQAYRTDLFREASRILGSECPSSDRHS